MRTSEVGFVGQVSALWGRDHPRLWRSLLAWSGDPDIASDAAAEAFAQLLRRGDAVNDPAAWVWTAAFRIAAGQLKAKRALPGELRHDVDGGGAEADDSLALVHALSGLGESDRRVVVLSLIAGWSAQEIGALESLSSGAVRVRLHRARRRLQKALEVHDG